MGKRLERLIGESRKTKTEIAEHIGVTDSTISKYCKGDIFIHVQYIKPLCEILDCDYHEILGELK